MITPNRETTPTEFIVHNFAGSDARQNETMVTEGGSPSGFAALADTYAIIGEGMRVNLPNLTSVIGAIQIQTLIESLKQMIEDLELRDSTNSTAIYDLNAAYYLVHPVQILIQESEDYCLASWPELNLYFEGQAASEAIAGLKEEIATLFDDLVSTPASELGILPKQWLRTLKLVVRESAETI